MSPSLPTPEHEALCDAVERALWRLCGRHGVAQPALTPPERSVLHVLNALRQGQHNVADEPVLAALFDVMQRPFSLSEATRRREG